MAQVESLLGKPTKADGGSLTYWYYFAPGNSYYDTSSGHVIFDDNNSVYGWDEPGN